MGRKTKTLIITDSNHVIMSAINPETISARIEKGNKMPKGNLYVVSGPSGAGKSTICRLVRKMLGINLATSATTRNQGQEK